jgi:hypothetical protein
LNRLLAELPGSGEIRKFHEDWNQGCEREALIVKTASTLDAWEMGVTTPTAWMHAWKDYGDRALKALKVIKNSGYRSAGVAGELHSLLTEGRIALGKFNSHEFSDGLTAGREPFVKPIRLGGT